MGEEELGPHLTQYGQGRGLPVPSFIHLTVWPQYTNVADRQTDRQSDRTTVR